MWENFLIAYSGKKRKEVQGFCGWGQLSKYSFQHLYLQTSRLLSGPSALINNFWKLHYMYRWFTKTLTPGSDHCYLDMSVAQAKFVCWNNYIYFVYCQNFPGCSWQYHSGFGRGRAAQCLSVGFPRSQYLILFWAPKAVSLRVATAPAHFLWDLLWKRMGLSLLKLELANRHGSDCSLPHARRKYRIRLFKHTSQTTRNLPLNLIYF